MDTLSIIRSSLGQIAGKRILDIGCGSGALAAALLAEGGEVAGVDVQEAALERARRNAPLAEFRVAPAQQLPFAEKTFDAAIFVNSLHHVEIPSMQQALAEAARVIKPGGHLIVIEPLPEGSFFETFRSIEDETIVRSEGQVAIGRFQPAGLRLARSTRFVRVEIFADFDAFIARTTAAKSSRLAVVEQKRESIRQEFETNSSRDKKGSYLFEQPVKFDVWIRVH